MYNPFYSLTIENVNLIPLNDGNLVVSIGLYLSHAALFYQVKLEIILTVGYSSTGSERTSLRDKTSRTPAA